MSNKSLAVDNNEDLEKLPINEIGLSDIIKEYRGKNLHFKKNIEESISIADLIFLCVNTPTKIKGIGAGQASDLRWIETSIRQIAKSAKNNTIIVQKSTIPVKTAETIKNLLNSIHSNNVKIKKDFFVLSNPEFLSEGTAIKDLNCPDRVLIGGDNENAIKALEKIYLKWLSPEKIIKLSLWSAELSKLTANAFLAQRISSINAISSLCEVTGANVLEVSKAIGKGGSNIRLAGKLTGYEIDVFREGVEEDIELKEFSDEIEEWVIEEFKKVGLDTAKSILELEKADLIKRTDLEDETVEEVLRILREEFEE